MPRKTGIPTYRLHKPTGQAVVTIGGKDRYLGEHGADASHEAYRRLIAEWIAGGRREAPAAAATLPAFTVTELCLRYLEHADAYYRLPDGTPTGEAEIHRRPQEG